MKIGIGIKITINDDELCGYREAKYDFSKAIEAMTPKEKGVLLEVLSDLKAHMDRLDGCIKQYVKQIPIP